MLVGARILQGCGGALMMPVGRITMVRAFPRDELVRAMSFVAIPGLIGPLLGPLAGGLIVGYFHWRMIFFVNLPIGLIGMYLVYRFMPDYRSERSDPIDFVGLTLFGSGIALLSYVLEVFGEHSLDTKEVVFLLVLSLVLLFAYARHALSAEHPAPQAGALQDPDLPGRRSPGASPPASASAGCRSSCRSSTSSASATRRSSRAS